jgi:hypothetical protein
MSQFHRTHTRKHRPTLVGSLLCALLALGVSAPGALASHGIRPQALRIATATVPYIQQLTATEGPYTYSVQSGSLPSGITLSAGGTLSGTAPAAGTSDFTVLASDQAEPAHNLTISYELTVQLDITPAKLPRRSGGDLMNTWLGIAGGEGEPDFTVSAGALPTGVYFADGGGAPTLLAGVIEKAGTFTFTLRATDHAGHTGSRTYTMKIGLGLLPGKREMDAGVLGQTYSQYLLPEGGSGSYAYAITAGTLPAGLSVESSEEGTTITGTPTSAGTYRFTLQVTDQQTGTSVSRSYEILILSSPFPIGTFELKEGENDLVAFVEPARAGNGHVSGTIFAYSQGNWTYNAKNDRLSFEQLTNSGPPLLFTATCEPVAQTCSGTGPHGPFTLARLVPES